MSPALVYTTKAEIRTAVGFKYLTSSTVFPNWSRRYSGKFILRRTKTGTDVLCPLPGKALTSCLKTDRFGNRIFFSGLESQNQSRQSETIGVR
jgi:hypothetical protein